MTELRNKLGDDTYERVMEAFRKKTIRTFEKYDIEYTDEDVNKVVKVFEKDLADGLDLRESENWNISTLINQLESPVEYGNVGIIMGMTAVRYPDSAARRLTNKKLSDKYG